MSTAAPGWPQVRAAVAAFMAKQDREWTTTGVAIQLAADMDVNIAPHNWTGYTTSEGDRFCEQIRRALNQLADEGVLAKNVRAARGRAKSAFYQPAERAAAQQQEAEQASRERRARRQQVERAFAAAGIPVGFRADDSVQIAADYVPQLLDLITRKDTP
jgi:hypothetical protein